MWQRRVKYSMLNRFAKKVYIKVYYAQWCYARSRVLPLIRVHTCNFEKKMIGLDIGTGKVVFDFPFSNVLVTNSKPFVCVKLV